MGQCQIILQFYNCSISDIDWKTPATLDLRLGFTNKFCQMANGLQKQLHIRKKIKGVLNSNFWPFSFELNKK